jgi:hypothetical protein
MVHGVSLTHKKLTTWFFIFQEYDFGVKHWPKIGNKDVDELSRNPSANDLDTIGTHFAWGSKLGDNAWLEFCFIFL